MRLLQTLKKSNPILVDGGSTNIHIKNLFFDGTGVDTAIRAIDIQNHTGSITIENCKFVNWRGATQRCVYLFNIKNLTLKNCWFENYTTACQVVGSTLDFCYFGYNKGKDIYSNNDVGLTSFFQMVTCGEVPSLIVEYNRTQGWKGRTGDMYNFFGTGGTLASPAKIRHNWGKNTVLSRDANGVITTNVASTAWNQGGGYIVVGDDGGSNIDIEDNIIINAANFGIQAVGENSATNHRLYRNKILIEKRDQIIDGFVSQSSLGLQTGNSNIIDCKNNLIAGWRTDENGGFLVNNIFPGVAGVTDDASNLYGQNAIDAGLIPSLLPENILI